MHLYTKLSKIFANAITLPFLRIIHIWKFNTIIAFSQSCHTRHSKNNWQKTASTEINLQQYKIRYNSKRWRLIWIYVVKFHPYIADFTPRTINIDIIFTISIIIETNTNLMTKFGHKHRTLNTSEWISSTTIAPPRKNYEKTRATRLATDWRMLPQRQLLNKGRAAWCVPCTVFFASFALQKKDTVSTTPNDCNQRLRVKQTEYLKKIKLSMLLLSSIDVRLIPIYTGSSYYQYLCKHYVLSVPTEKHD